MLAFPLKRTEKCFYLDRKMKRYLKRQAQEGHSLFRKLFPKDDSHEKHFEDVDELTSLRTRVVRAKVGSDKTLELLENYYTQLIHISKRFPVGSTDLILTFRWRDAFEPILHQESTSIEYEIACILFNIAATHSQIACEKSDEPKVAAKHFRIAAGVLDKLLKAPGRTGRDLRDETITTLKGMCLASAQTLFYLTAKRANMSPKLLSTLSMGGAEMWQKIQVLGKRNLGRVWSARIEFQKNCMEATGHRWRGKAGEEKDQGFLIARYKLAETAALKAEDIAIRQRLVGLDDQMKPLIAAIQSELRDAVDTNNGVMMDRVPDSHEMDKITGRTMVKAVEYEEPKGKDGSVLFKGVLPPNVTKMAREFKELAENVLTKKQEETKLASDTARAKLASMNLPGALDSKSDGGGVPDDLWDEIVSFRRTGGVQGMQDRISKCRDTGDDVSRKLQKCKNVLDTERRQDETYRARFQGHWNRLQSERLIGSFEAEIAQYEKTLRKARESDMKVEKKLMSVMDVLSGPLMTDSRADMERTLPGDGGSSASSGNKNSSSLLRKVLVDVSNLLKQRDEALSRMEIALTGDGDDVFVKSLLEMSSNIKKDDVFKAELQRRVGKDTKFLADSVKQQADLMDQVTSQFSEWNKSSGVVDQNRARAINSLRNCVDKAREIDRDVRTGERFYETLKRHVERTEQVVEDHLEARGMEAKDMEGRQQNHRPPPPVSSFDREFSSKQEDEEIDVPRELAASMAQLSMMGFTDVSRNVQALRETNGDVKAAVEKLVS